MRNLEASPWLGNPELVEIKLVPAPGTAKDRDLKINEFILNFLDQARGAHRGQARTGAGGRLPRRAKAAAPPAKAKAEVAKPGRAA